MERFRNSQLLLIVVDIVIIVLSTDCRSVNGHSINGRWFIEKQPQHQQSTGQESSRLCSDIIQVTRKLLENDLIRDVIYPKLTEDIMFGKSTKIIETRAPSRRNVVHFPSKQYYPVDHNQQFNRSENSRFKRHHGLRPFPSDNLHHHHQQQQKLFHHHFPKIEPLTTQTINLVPLNPYEETEPMEVNRPPQAYIVDLTSLHDPQTAATSINQDDGQIDLPRQVRPRYYVNNGNGQDDVTLERRQDDVREEGQDGDGSEGEGGESETEVDSKNPNVVKKTFGYKVTLYKSPNIQEPQILTEEFFGDGKKKKVIKILKKDEKSSEGQKSRSEQLSQQSSSSSGRYIPQFVAAPVGSVDQNDEDELEANRKLLGAVRKQLASEKGIEATRTISKSGDEKQHDKKGAKEKALREKTQIEFFEREKIFANDDRYGKKLDGHQQQQQQNNIQHQFPAMQDRPEIVRLTTVAPDPPPSRDRDTITVVSSPDDINSVGNTGGMDFQSLHDLLLKRLKGWREKGYKITTELEIVQRGAVHDKERSVRERGKGQQTFQRYESGGSVRGKSPASFSGSTINDQQGFGQIEPLSVTHVSPENERSHHTMKVNGGQKTATSLTEDDQENQGNLFSSLPKFLLDPPDYETSLDGPNGQKMDQVMELVNQQDPQQQLHLQPHPQPPHHLVHSPPHHHHTVLLHHHHLQHPPPPEALKLVQPNQTNPPKISRLVSINNTTNGSTTTTPRPVRKGRKYSFKGMTRKIPSNENGHNTSAHDENHNQMNKNLEKMKVTSPPSPVSFLLSDKSENTLNNNNLNNIRSKTSTNKQTKDGQSNRRLAAQKRIKAKAKQKAKLQQQLQQKQFKNQVKQQQKLQQHQQQQIKQQLNQQLQHQQIKPTQQSVNQSKQPNIFRPPMSIQDQILFPASPLVSNSVRGLTDGIPTPPPPPHPGSVDLTNPLSFLDGVHESLYMPTENGFDDISFGNPTLITLPGLLDGSHNGDHDNPLNDHFRSFMNQGTGIGGGGGGGDGDVNGGKKNFLNFQDLTEPEKKRPRPNSMTFEDPMNSLRPPPHTEILIGKPAPSPPVKQLTNSLTSTGQYSNNNNGKMRDYPTSIQDITRGKKMSTNYGVEPGFGRETPDNLILPGKEGDPLLNHFKNDYFNNNNNNNKLNPNDWTDHQGLTIGNDNNQQDKPNTVNWLQHDDLSVNLMKNNPRSTVQWDRQPKVLNNFNHQQSHGVNPQTNQLIVNNNNNYLEGNRGSTRFSTEKPFRKQKSSFNFDESTDLIPDSPKEVKPGAYRQSIWAEPEFEERGKKRKKKKKNKINGQQSGHNVNPQHQQLTEDIFSVGFDSQRMRSPKNFDLISRSSQIYPLIGGYSPFIIPSTPNENISVEPEIDSDHETDSNVDDDDDDQEDDEISVNDSSYLNQHHDNNQPTDQIINGDDRRRKFHESAQESIMNINNSDNYPPSPPSNATKTTDLDQESSNNQQEKLITNRSVLITDKIDEVKSNQQIKIVNTTEISPFIGLTEKPSRSLIWSQPCPSCPEF